MVKQEKGKKKDQGKRSRILLILCTVVIIALLATVVVLLLKDRNDASGEETLSPKRNVVVNEENAEQVAEEILNPENVMVPGTYEVTMNSTWNFRDGTSSSDNAYVENSNANTTPVYFDLQMADTEEVIYESPVIPVGGYLDDIKLDTDLDAGIYDCVLTYHLVDEEQNTLATLRMAVTVVVAD